jgi:hypothetical protein
VQALHKEPEKQASAQQLASQPWMLGRSGIQLPAAPCSTQEFYRLPTVQQKQQLLLCSSLRPWLQLLQLLWQQVDGGTQPEVQQQGALYSSLSKQQ